MPDRGGMMRTRLDRSGKWGNLASASSNPRARHAPNDIEHLQRKTYDPVPAPKLCSDVLALSIFSVLK